MVCKRIVFIAILLSCFIALVEASDQVSGIIQFDQTTYKGARQNWSVSVSETGTVYFANHTGLLVFDGTTWTLNNLPNRTILRSVKARNDSVIYTGGYMELGYWKPNERGELIYYSLDSKARSFLDSMPNMEFWNIAVKDDYVYFQSFQKILAYHNDSIIPIDLDGSISVMNQVNNKVLVSVRNNGIWEIDGEDVKPVTTSEKLIGTTAKFILPFEDSNILIGTVEQGILMWDGKEISTWNESWNQYFIDNELNRGYYTDEKKVLIGTLADGLIVFNKDGDALNKINTENGLSNNTVLGIVCDRWHNIWLALDIGIGFISGNQQRSFTIQRLPGTGAIYASAIFDNKLYLGTNQGLFVKSNDFKDNHVSIIPETQDQIWDLKVFGEELLVGHNQGTFVVKNDKFNQISDEAGAFNFVQDPFYPNLIIQSTYNNLVVYEKTENGIMRRNSINGFANLIRYIEFDHLGNIWASHMHRGIFKIQVDDRRENVLSSEYFGQNAFGKDNTIHVFKVENRIVFTTGEKLYTFDDLQDSIVPHTMLNGTVGKYASSHRIVPAPNHHYWFLGKEYIGLFSILQDNIKLIKEYPTSIFNNPLPVEGFENLLPTNEYSAILCLQNGLALLDASVTNNTVDLIEQFRPVARKIELNNPKNKSISLPLEANEAVINYNYNTVSLRFSFPFLSGIPVSYKYLLEGLGDEWSETGPNSEFRFERLPPGEYVFKVKAVNLWGKESQIYRFSFKVLPPLYASKWAILFYVVILIAVLLIFRRLGIRKTLRKEQMQHEKREQELVRLRNEKLRSEVRFKSKELANSTMAIIRKNEFLIDLKMIIRKHKNELGSRYPDKYYNYLNSKIDDNISSRDDRKIFENNFERAYEQFFQKMKTEYPELTSSDLQLCAYLRMNLSSKEIAPLLGISVRGVENHRYRLRKKLNLEHDESLIDNILRVSL
ncbi:helix-turn-helix and ligand-binding sensor domain-containing protein [Maribellus sediminis]|uniref:helix-turn-helix and ligand-binding sensor domain-containing protein n=1 Tax=Maribellus sediminis TaxID=2696285 RepID=UPI001431E3F5|nr:triple tyrosine motif-containing protein [Maribellus sediminis]